MLANPVTPSGTTPVRTSGRLADTGLEGAPLGALAGSLILGGLALAWVRRRVTA